LVAGDRPMRLRTPRWPEQAYGEHLGHVVMLDPEGNEFCVA
jgi:hypothetical protein